LRFVANHACLVCGRKHSDPHHLGFHNRGRSAARSATNWRFRCVASIIAKFTASATNGSGGSGLASNPSRLLVSCGQMRA
jgi:hypothetical protein